MNESTMTIAPKIIRNAALPAALKMLVLLAFVMRSLIPLGFMPGKASAEGGLFPVVICSGASSSTVYLPADKVPGEHPAHPNASHAPCVFAFNTLFGGAIDTLTVLPLALSLLRHLPRLYDALIPAASPAGYFPQGPPAFLSQN